jgi:hypothetical protein
MEKKHDCLEVLGDAEGGSQTTALNFVQVFKCHDVTIMWTVLVLKVAWFSHVQPIIFNMLSRTHCSCSSQTLPTKIITFPCQKLKKKGLNTKAGPMFLVTFQETW